MINENSCSANRVSWLIKEASIFLLRLKNRIWDETELAADETIFDLFNWSIYSACDALREVTEAIFEVKDLKTIAFIEEVEVSILIISTLLAVVEELLTISSSKKTFVWKFFINFISLIIKSAARRFSWIDAESSK